MSQTKQQEQGAAPATPKARKDWELFWRIVAGLMLLVIAWMLWVLYQITPRSVVTPLAYTGKIKSGDTQQPAAMAPVGVVPAAPPPVTEPTAADRAMASAQEAVRSGAHQASADVQAAAMDDKPDALKPELAKGEGLRLATEIAVPPAGKPESATAVPAASGAAGKDRP